MNNNAEEVFDEDEFLKVNFIHIRLGHYSFGDAYCLSVKNADLALELSMHIRLIRD